LDALKLFTNSLQKLTGHSERGGPAFSSAPFSGAPGHVERISAPSRDFCAMNPSSISANHDRWCRSNLTRTRANNLYVITTSKSDTKQSTSSSLLSSLVKNRGRG